MAFFSSVGSSESGAVITVIYDSSFYNKPITCSNGIKTYTKTTTSSGSTEFKVSDEGTWTITCDGVSVIVSVVLSYSTEMRPTGSTATPVNDIQLWLKCGSIFDKNYTTISQVLSDTTTLLALISDNNAVDYMVRSTTWASDVCADSTAMTDIGANSYCADTLLSDSTWLSAIANSTYFESVLNVKVPYMTSNSAPEGECLYTSEFSGRYAYFAFQHENNPATAVTSIWLSNQQTTPVYIGYHFTSPVVVNKIKVMFALASSTTNTSTTFTLQGSNTGNSDDWHDIGSAITDTNTTATGYSFVNSAAYEYYRINITAQTISGASYKGAVNILQFYGRASS